MYNGTDGGERWCHRVSERCIPHELRPGEEERVRGEGGGRAEAEKGILSKMAHDNRIRSTNECSGLCENADISASELQGVYSDGEQSGGD